MIWGEMTDWPTPTPPEPFISDEDHELGVAHGQVISSHHTSVGGIKGFFYGIAELWTRYRE
jgi:hypothetical protein